ncbi:MAG: MobF family relaxase [Chloroflexota bacterium]
MRAVVTVLRAPRGLAASAAVAAVDYLCGPRQLPLSESGPAGSVTGYYADQTCDGPGRWLGIGARRIGLSGSVVREDLEALLAGRDPRADRELVGTRGSNVRTIAARSQPTDVTWGQSEYGFRDAAALLGVDASHLRRVAGRTRRLLVRTGGDANSLAKLEADGRAYLIAHQGDDGAWRVSHDELARFAAARHAARRVIGYDVTFSVPKSVSILAAVGDETTRTAIRRAFDRAVEVGVGYLERHAAVSGRNSELVAGRGLTAAAFRHETSRRLDPQLHTHVVIANVVETHSGDHRALNGSGLFAHAKTAAYLAGASLRRDLTIELGVTWRSVQSGITEIAKVPEAAIEEMSARRRDIDTLAAELGIDTPQGRRALALRSRAPKLVESLDGLRAEWEQRLDTIGFDDRARAACLNGTRAPASVRPEDTEALFRQLDRHDGLTANASTFTRGDVVQAIADWAVDRLEPAAIEACADQFLATSAVLALLPARGSHRIESLTTRPRSVAELEPRFTTRALVEAELTILGSARHLTDLAIEPQLVRDALGETDLAADQRDALRRLAASRGHVDCLVGAAGTGKTHTVTALAALWASAGRAVHGAAVQGTAAEHLQATTGIPTATLASLLATIDRSAPDRPTLTAGSLVVVDEASTVGTFDLARLVRAVQDANAKLLLVGDPAQHGAVPAGGGFAGLVRRHPARVCTLVTPRRQAAPELESARAALADLRARDTDAGLHRLLVDGRIHETANRDETCAAIVADWHKDRLAAQNDPRRLASSMITDRHATRRDLNRRARVVLQATGELHGPTLRVAGIELQAGDEVICRAPARDLHPPDAPDRYLRNGTPGRVTAVDPARGAWIDFAHRGEIRVPTGALNRPVRPGVVGLLTHSYALTSHAAQGMTFETARMLTTSAATPAALYVGASRGRSDVRLYPTAGEEEVVAAASDSSGLQTLTRALRHRSDDVLALDRDPSLAHRRPDTPQGGQEPHLDVAPLAPPVPKVPAAAPSLSL